MRSMRASRTVAGVLAVALLFPVVLFAQTTTYRVHSTHQSVEHSFAVRELVSGLRNPWAIAFVDDSTLLISERPGTLRLLTSLDGNGRLLTVEGVPEVVAGGQGGLLDVIIDPQFQTNNRVYLAHVVRTADGGTGTRVSSARLDRTDGSERLSAVRTLFTMNRGGRSGNHFGARMVIADDGYLYIALGDRGEQNRAQDPSDHAGSVIRLARDGSIPSANPFAAGRTPDGSAAAPEVFSFGHRNGQGIALHPHTRSVWMHEHGPRGGDEVNVLRAGANYGWPLATYGVAYSGAQIAASPTAPGTEPPLLHWTPSIAPSGMTFYTGLRFPQWRDNLFVGALAGRHIRRVVLDGTSVVEQESLLVGFDRIRDVRTGPDGFIYFITDSARGSLYRLETDN